MPRDQRPEDNQRAVELARVIADHVNSGHRDARDVAKLLCREHRTIQQSVMRLCAAFLEEMAVNSSDLRNEASVAFAKKVVAATDDVDRIMPYV